jgi:hypothetical protein
MSKAITAPLASIIAAARKGLPQTTGATARADQRRNRPRRQIILADVSASMAEPAAGRRKVDILGEALEQLSPAGGVVAFASSVMPLALRDQLPQPSGGTALHLALSHCLDAGATDVLVISDGHPDRPGEALAVADRLDARIDVIYCGPDNDIVGMDFMRQLARGGGAAHHRSLSTPQNLIATARSLMIEGPR